MGGADSDLLSQIRDQFRDLPERLAIALSRYGSLGGSGTRPGDGGPGTAGGPPGFRDRWQATQGLLGAAGGLGFGPLGQLAALMGNLARLADAADRFGAAFGVGRPTLVSGDRPSPFATPWGGSPLPAPVPPPPPLPAAPLPAGPFSAAVPPAPSRLPPGPFSAAGPGVPYVPAPAAPAPPPVSAPPPTTPVPPPAPAPAPPQVLTDAERAQLVKQLGAVLAADFEKRLREQAAAAVPPAPAVAAPAAPAPVAAPAASVTPSAAPGAFSSARPAAPVPPAATPLAPPAAPPSPAPPPGPVPAAPSAALPPVPAPPAPVAAPVAPPPPLPPPYPDVPAVGEAERREFTAGWDAGLAGLLPPGGPPEVGGGLWPAAGEEAAVPGLGGAGVPGGDRLGTALDKLNRGVDKLNEQVQLLAREEGGDETEEAENVSFKPMWRPSAEEGGKPGVGREGGGEQPPEPGKRPEKKGKTAADMVDKAKEGIDIARLLAGFFGI